MTKEQLQHELDTIREKRLSAERKVDDYERRAIRACRRGQAMHVERRVAEMERDMVAPLRQREIELEAQLAQAEVEA